MGEHGALVEGLIFLTAAVVCVPLASRAGLGAVLGYLGAGCLIGPHALALVGDVDATMTVAELGVVLMLFVIGLELDPQRLWGMRRLVFGGGALQVLGCAAVLALGAAAVGLPWRAAVVAGLALSLSSTAIAMQTMSDRGLLGAPLGRAGFGVLLFQDLAAIPILSLVPLLALDAGAEGAAGPREAAVALAAIALAVGAGRYLTRPLLRAVARTGLREVFTAAALLLVLAIAGLMALAGLSMGLGAFLGGVLLASSEYRHALETDLEPFKGLLLGLFFISVGMSIDFGLFARHPGLVLVLLLGFQALKGGVLALLAPRLGVAREQRGLFGLLLVQGSELAFVVFGVARSSRALPGEWEGLLTLTVALSMALSPLLLLAHDRIAVRREVGKREADVVEAQGSEVIVAGFGRFGQIVGRLLFASGIRATVLDHDPDQIDMLRRFGFRVFYGDATRLDLLEAAGAGEARLLVVAIDDMDAGLALVDRARERFPHLRILARARNVTHYLALRERGIEVIERDTFESALRLGQRALVSLGVGAYEARERADRFRRHNLASLEALMPHLRDEAQRLSMSKTAREELEKQFERDRAALVRRGGGGWQADLEGADRERASRVG